MSGIWILCCFRKKLHLFLVVEGNDRKLAGANKSLADGWRLIRSELSMEDPTKLGVCLSSDHTREETRLADGTPAVMMKYGMGSYVRGCVIKSGPRSGYSAPRR